MSDYRQLEVWKKAHAVTMEVYALTKSFPAEERFGLVAKCAAAESLLALIWLKAEADAGIPNSDDSSGSRLAQHTNCSTNYWSRQTQDS